MRMSSSASACSSTTHLIFDPPCTPHRGSCTFHLFSLFFLAFSRSAAAIDRKS